VRNHEQLFFTKKENNNARSLFSAFYAIFLTFFQQKGGQMPRVQKVPNLSPHEKSEKISCNASSYLYPMQYIAKKFATYNGGINNVEMRLPV